MIRRIANTIEIVMKILILGMNSQMIKIRAFLLSKIWKVNTFIIIKEKIFINKNKIKDKIKKNQFKRK